MKSGAQAAGWAISILHDCSVLFPSESRRFRDILCLRLLGESHDVVPPHWGGGVVCRRRISCCSCIPKRQEGISQSTLAANGGARCEVVCARSDRRGRRPESYPAGGVRVHSRRKHVSRDASSFWS